MSRTLRSGQLAKAAGVNVQLRDAAEKKLAEVEAKIVDLHQVRATLIDVLTAGCSDLAECSCTPGCPIPFADLGRGAARQPTTQDDAEAVTAGVGKRRAR